MNPLLLRQKEGISLLGKTVVMPTVERKVVEHESLYSTYSATVKNKFVRWVSAKVFKFLRKTGYIRPALFFEHEISMTRYEIDLDKLDEEIAKNKHAIEMVYYKRVDTLIVGMDIMQKIMTGDPHRVGQLNLQLNGESQYARASRYGAWGAMYERVQYTGLNIILVPWFEGILLLEAPSNENTRNYTPYPEDFRLN